MDTKKYKTLVIYGDERVGNPLFRMSSRAISKSFTVKKNWVYISALPLTSCFCCSYITQPVFSSAQSHKPPSWLKGGAVRYYVCLIHSCVSSTYHSMCHTVGNFPSVWCSTLIDLHILKNLCIPGINQIDHGVWAFWYVAEFYLVKFYWGLLHLCSSGILACSFLFLCCLCLVMVLGWWWSHRMSLKVFLPLQFFGRVLEG